ncbi:hypothetical protein K432DRAFT_291807 [Lepidopterella palustris CBS 459.81]|uniref:cysteine--tRNA ligase n=1 Tax=Lepidopterella palustris CBS 459.81 TaxID=1314670 RepID=A0A8E2JHT5_9PEZI|nr:hypothetical protein K432DRAFT_291807 [Lepidopterella palustris CBS 459.81]
MASPARTQPPWKAPESAIPPKLKIYNSLTRTKNDFVPLDSEGRKVTWYSCGPTVYDDSHLGHARNYVSIDILRRVLAHYFDYDLKFVQNITDVDDKIILRGRQQYLLFDFKSKHQNPDDAFSYSSKAFQAYVKKNLPLLPANIQPEAYNAEAKKAYGAILGGKPLASDAEAKTKMHLSTASSAAAALLMAQNDPKFDVADFYTKTEDVLLPYLDSLYGASIDANDHSIFTKLTQKYEQRFMEDMRSLNVLDPDVVTRVTEYGPQIVEFVEKIVKNGFGYVTSDGSVYFDIQAFEQRPGNHYARLEPWNRGNQELQADGEGALTKKSTEKRGDADFALWKSSKPGEPSWPSPWGPGRPGWHIECSAMASDVLGKSIDIHSGGIDLCFPHHDNELAQSEAYWSTTDGSPHGHQWIQYFMHMGHLSISGSKMSKSLKNFTTIREALSRGDWNARSLRIIFLIGGWKDGVEITDGLRAQGKSLESYLDNFFLKAKDLQRNPTENSPTPQDEKLRDALAYTKTALHDALSDSFDTPAAMRAISNLITEYNSADQVAITDNTVLEIARWITKIVRIFGLDGSADPNDGTVGWSGIDIPEEAKEFVYAVSRERDEVRQHAIAGNLSEEKLAAIVEKDFVKGQQNDKAAAPYVEVLASFRESLKGLAREKAPAKDFLALCDKLRNLDLWDLGIYLEDREGRPALVRPVDSELRAARQQKEERELQKREAKEKREAEEAEKAKKRAEMARISPKDMFRTEEYSLWDEEGFPVRDAKGEEVPKSKGKKLRKEWERQRKLHEEWLAGQGQG